MTTLTEKAAQSGSKSSLTKEKVEQPAKVFSNAKEVVADPALSASEKRRALDALEQDARQLAVASAEGMSGGEQSKLSQVLNSKRTLESAETDAAFVVVTRTFEARLRETEGTDTHAAIVRAIDAITAARQAIAEHANAPAPPPGAPQPGSDAELQEELDKEKLDPGA